MINIIKKLIPSLVLFFSNTENNSHLKGPEASVAQQPLRPSRLRTNYAFFITLLTGAIKANVLALFFFFFKSTCPEA